ncbi:MAG: type II secretion system minor pseudopilin GspI [Nitrosomonadales bacterium]|nr:type II secretion system minor pseudopilin GspI [Nitrosomonadales bacterium]
MNILGSTNLTSPLPCRERARERVETPPTPRPTCRGFTLLEVLVALFILAITMAAVSRTASSSIQHVDALRTRVIADWVAQNRLATHQARGDYPQPGIQTGSEEQAGQTYPWQEEIIATPNPTMRRIIVNVYAPEDTKHSLRELTGYLVQNPR